MLKDFGGKPWESAQKQGNTSLLLIKNGNLPDSVYPDIISCGKIVIKADNDKLS